MKKKSIIIILLIVFFLSGCQKSTTIKAQRYSNSFYDTFNTLVVVVGYTETEEEFQNYFTMIENSFKKYHKLYDIYNNCEGINNIKTINDNAGIKPVEVDKEIIDLILFSKEWYEKTGSSTNIAFGPVLKIWHDYRMEGLADPENAAYPPIEKLKEAWKYTDINKVIVDIDNNTVFLEETGMSLDVGAVAKGYTAEMVARELYNEGFVSGIISAGGNIKTIGQPLDPQREKWVVGIQNPNASILSDEKDLDAVFINTGSVVSSGDYQRYYYVGEELVHHLIDPKTLLPATHYRAVTIVAEDSGVADFISTVAFLEPYEISRRIIEDLDGVEAIWVMPNGEIEFTDGMKKMLRSQGATNQR